LPRNALPRRYDLDFEPRIADGGFDGTVAVLLDLVEPTDSLVLNAAGLTILDASVELPDNTTLPGSVSTSTEAQQATVKLPSVLPPAADYRLVMRFSGAFDDHLRGFYRSTFLADDGTEYPIVTTQFEPSDARRAFPCWDEPDFKASFAISLLVDDGLTALSNEEVESVETLPDGRRRVSFAPTMVMSTYLVAFVVGPYELTQPVDVDGVPLRIAAAPGRAPLTPFAQEAAAHSLRFLSGYFAIPYPASKIDHVAVPDFAFGAMENVGCVTYRETALLVDPAAASQAEIQRVATVIAHETAHMWFGNLVTMRWWEGIWLNEAFATFMELMTTDDFRPEWQVWTAFGAGKQAAMVVDGLDATRPVEFAVGRPEEAEAMFDLLTYQKGGAVLRMLEQYLGPEVFRKGISHYLSTHAYANTQTPDLWNALESVSGEPIGSIMDSWIHQGGYPLISVETAGEPSTLRFSQSRFTYTPGAPAASWSVPVTLRASVGGSVAQHRLLLDAGEASVSFDQPVDWVVVNDGGWGFYRVRYSPELLDVLLTGEAAASLRPLERLGLVADGWAAVVAGLGGLGQWLRTAVTVDAGDDPDVWAAIASVLASLDNLAGDDDRPPLRRFVHRVADPAWQELGWDAAGDGPRRSSARARVLGVLGLIGGDEGIAAEAGRRFADLTAGSASLAPDLVGVTASIVVSTGSEKEWSKVLDMYRSSSNPQEKMRYLDALTEARQPGLRLRTLDLCLSEQVRTQDAPFVIRDVLAGRGAGAATWGWIEEHWTDLITRFPASLLSRSLEGLVSITDPALAQRVTSFCNERDVPMAGPRLDQILERMRVNVALAGRLRGTFAAEGAG
jgi:puromycin-sensitive aminopeptidase